MAIDLVEHNPRLKEPVACVLGMYAEVETFDRAQLEEQLSQVWRESYSQAPATIIESLLRNGALAEQIVVDGQVYDGPLEAEVSDGISITQAGRDLAASLDPGFTMRGLLADRPHYRDVFARVICVCAASDGASREAVEQAVEQDGNVVSPDGKRVYPQYFMDALETAGGIIWDGVWRATQAGLRAIA